MKATSPGIVAGSLLLTLFAFFWSFFSCRLSVLSLYAHFYLSLVIYWWSNVIRLLSASFPTFFTFLWLFLFPVFLIILSKYIHSFIGFFHLLSQLCFSCAPRLVPACSVLTAYLIPIFHFLYYSLPVLVIICCLCTLSCQFIYFRCRCEERKEINPVNEHCVKDKREINEHQE